MWSEVTISPANLDEYEALCHRLSEGQKIFSCGHRAALWQDEWEDGTNLTDSTHESSKITETHKRKNEKVDDSTSKTGKNLKVYKEIDVKELQREVIHILQGSGAADVELSKAVGCKEVCEGAGDIEEEVLLRACSKVKRDESLVALVGKLLLLPKLYHLDTCLSTPVKDALTQLMETHTSIVVESILHPLLLHLPSLQQQHRDVLVHLMPTCPPHLATRLLRAFSERVHQTDSDADLLIFHLLLDAADPKDTDTHTSALTVIARASQLHGSNIKFGQCLSVVLKRFGPHMSDLEAVRFAVNTHTSSLRKLLESKLKRLDKK